MAVQKKKISVTIDADLVAALEEMGSNVSSTINQALRAEVERRRQQEGLKELVEYLQGIHGPMDSPEDEAEIQRLMSLLGGPTQASPEHVAA